MQLEMFLIGLELWRMLNIMSTIKTYPATNTRDPNGREACLTIFQNLYIVLTISFWQNMLKKHVKKMFCCVVLFKQQRSSERRYFLSGAWTETMRWHVQDPSVRHHRSLFTLGYIISCDLSLLEFFHHPLLKVAWFIAQSKWHLLYIVISTKILS